MLEKVLVVDEKSDVVLFECLSENTEICLYNPLVNSITH